LDVIVSRSYPERAEARAFEDAVGAAFASETGSDVLVVPHLYHIAEQDGVWAELAALAGPLMVLCWMYPRPVEWVLRRHGIGEVGLSVADLSTFDDVAQCLDACSAQVDRTPCDGSIRELAADISGRWHPVLDYSRCINCGQCLQFCLFGVFALDEEGVVRATEPDNCKLGCPACSRVCPRGAIMFPLYRKDDAMAGAPGQFVTPDDAARRMFEQRTKRLHKQAPADDDLDALIDDLDRLAERGL